MYLQQKYLTIETVFDLLLRNRYKNCENSQFVYYVKQAIYIGIHQDPLSEDKNKNYKENNYSKRKLLSFKITIFVTQKYNNRYDRRFESTKSHTCRKKEIQQVAF